MRAWADIRLYWHEGKDDISINLSIGVFEIEIFSPEALVPDAEECKLYVVVHPWSICFDILSKFLVCQFVERINHPALNLGAEAVVVFEHPDKIVISHTLRGWVCVQVAEPVKEVVIDCLVPVVDKVIPSLFIVAHWSCIWD